MLTTVNVTRTVLFLLLFCMPAQAQLLPGVSQKALKKTVQNAAHYKPTPVLLRYEPLTVRGAYKASLVPYSDQAVEHAVQKAVEKSLDLSSVVERDIHRYTLQVLDRTGGIKATAFLFSFDFLGKTDRWIAVTSHAVAKGNIVRLRFVNAQGAWETATLPVEVSGNVQRIDMSLVKLPEDSKFSHLKTLHWASQPPPTGQVVDSYGYSGQFLVEESRIKKIKSRKIIDVNDIKLTTDFKFPYGESGGACGSPLINRSGEVVGMHCGSWNGEKSFAITRTGVELLLRAHYTGHAYVPLKIYGEEVGLLDADEALYKITVLRGNRLVKNTTLSSMLQPPDSEHLEKFFSFKSGDVVTLFVSNSEWISRQINVNIP